MSTCDHISLPGCLVKAQGSWPKVRGVEPAGSARTRLFPRWKALLPGTGIPVGSAPGGAPPTQRKWEGWGTASGQRPQRGHRGLQAGSGMGFPGMSMQQLRPQFCSKPGLL